MSSKVYVVLHEWLNRDENFDTDILGVFKNNDNAVKCMRNERDKLLEEIYGISLEIATQSEYYMCNDTDDEFSIADMCDYPWDKISIIEEKLV